MLHIFGDNNGVQCPPVIYSYHNTTRAPWSIIYTIGNNPGLPLYIVPLEPHDGPGITTHIVPLEPHNGPGLTIHLYHSSHLKALGLPLTIPLGL